jgi:hypothetical protein
MFSTLLGMAYDVLWDTKGLMNTIIVVSSSPLVIAYGELVFAS